jgi:hypothetical protein
MMKEAQERVLRVEAGSTVAIASAREENEGLAERLPSSRVNLQRCTGLERWPRRMPVACLMQRLMPSGGGRSPTEGVGTSWRSSPSCRPGAPSCGLPLLILDGLGITCRRGCGSLHYTTLRWPESLPHFKRWCLLPCSSCLGAHTMNPSGWRVWMSYLPNSGSLKSSTHDLSGLA